MSDESVSVVSILRRMGDDDKSGEAGPYPTRSLSAHTRDEATIALVLSTSRMHSRRKVLVSVDRNIEDHRAPESSVRLCGGGRPTASRGLSALP